MNQELSYPISELKSVVNDWLHLDDDSVVDVIMAAYIANQFNTDPLWLMIIGPPSNTKTELLRGFDGYKNVYYLSNLTPSTLVSGKDTKKGDQSLLPKLNKKFVILKDFTTILSMRSENQAEILAQLREVYDGQYSKAFGTGKEFHWKGKIGMVAACTPAYDKHYSVVGSLGERFLVYRSDGNDNLKMGLQAQITVGVEDTMRKAINVSFHKFLNQFNGIKSLGVTTDETRKIMLVMLACFVAIGRCPVERDYRNQCVLYDPQPEGSPRIVKQLALIGSAVAMVHGKTTIDAGAYRILKKVAMDQLPVRRLKILNHLWSIGASVSYGGWKKTKDIANAVNTPAKTALLTLEDLMMAGALKRMQDGDGETAPYQWQISENMENYIASSEIFECFLA